MSENMNIMNTINIKPKKRWEKDEIVVKEGYGDNVTCKYNKHIKNRTAHQFILTGGTRDYFYLEDKGEYLGLYMYKCPGDWDTYFREGRFEEADEINAHVALSDFTTANRINRFDPLPGDRLGNTICYYAVKPQFEETRIYKDKKAVRVAWCKVSSESYKNVENPRPVSEEGYFINFDLDCYYTDGILTEVHNDEEIRKYAKKITKKHFKQQIRLYDRNGYSLCDIWDNNLNGYWNIDYTRFSEQHQEILKRFFDTDTSFYNFESLYTFLTQAAVQAKNPADTKREHGRRLLNFIGKPQSITTDAENNIKNLYTRWGRLDDEIVLCQKAYDHSNLYYIFAYNVKTKKRFYGEYNDSEYGGGWEFPIPSYQLISQRFRIDEGNWHEYSWWSKSKYKAVVHQEIKDNISIQELFKGSNVEVLIQHGDLKTLASYDCNSSYRWGSTEVQCIKDIINERYINSIVFAVIFSTGTPVLEQMLKSGLYNLYLKELEYQMKAGRNDVNWLWDKNKSQDSVSKYYYKDRVQMIYNSKGKNLKEMFGLTMNQLRIIDAMSILTDIPVNDDDGDDDKKHKKAYRRKICIAGMDDFYGVPVNNLDEKTFKTILETAKMNEYVPDMGRLTDGYNYNYLTFCCEAPQTVKDKLSEMPIQTKIKAAKLFLSVDQRTVIDYLNMREKLQEIQQKKLDIEDIWNEKRYPIIPEGAIKFVPFRRGNLDRLTQGYEVTDLFDYTKYGDISIYFRDESHLDLLKNDGSYVGYEERRAYNEILSKFEKKYNETREDIIGVLVKMDPAGHINYLHDDISYWVRFYQNAAKDKDFKEAVKRVKPLEWKDEKSGLEIIAPTRVGDMTREGEVLSHCVASYVDSIIDGTENIMFLRRSDMINEPYYTVEVLNDGEIRQVHCYRNGSLTEEAQKNAYENSGKEVYNKTFDIVGFLLKWAKAMKGKVDAKTIKSSYGALCAIRR